MLVNGTYINSRACCCCVRLLYNTGHQARDSSAPECCSMQGCLFIPTSGIQLPQTQQHDTGWAHGASLQVAATTIHIGYTTTFHNKSISVPWQCWALICLLIAWYTAATFRSIALFHPSTAIRSMWGSAQSYAHALCLVNFRKSSCSQQPQAAAELQLPDPVWNDMYVLPRECSSVMGVHVRMMCCMSQHACTWLVSVVSVPISCQIMVRADVNAQLLSSSACLCCRWHPKPRSQWPAPFAA